MQFVKRKADDDEDDRESGETKQLHRLPAQPVHKGNGEPIPRQCASAYQDQCTDCVVVQLLIQVLATIVSDSCEDRSVVESKTIES